MNCTRNPARSMLRWLVENGVAPLKTVSSLKHRRLKTQPLEFRTGRRIRQVADPILHIKSCGGYRLTVKPTDIKGPSGLTQPGPNVGLELGLIFFGNSPTGHVSLQIIFHRIAGFDLLDRDWGIAVTD